jgi:hypothetical protein
MGIRPDLPEEYQSLMELAELARAQDKPLPSLNVMTAGGAGSGKLALTEAYAQALLEKKLIRKRASVVDCDNLSSVGVMFARLTEEFSRAKDGMIIFEHASRLGDDATVLNTLLDLSRESGCVVALVDEKKGLQRLCGMTSSIMAQFPTMMDVENPAPPKPRPTNEELSTLPADIRAMKKLQIKKPEN